MISASVTNVVNITKGMITVKKQLELLETE